jgi:hypothetical protein
MPRHRTPQFQPGHLFGDGSEEAQVEADDIGNGIVAGVDRERRLNAGREEITAPFRLSALPPARTSESRRLLSRN